jgi:hypothetical protein
LYVSVCAVLHNCQALDECIRHFSLFNSFFIILIRNFMWRSRHSKYRESTFIRPRSRLSKSFPLPTIRRFFFTLWGGVRLSPLGTSATVGLMYQPRMVDEYGAFGGMRIGRGNRSTPRKPASMPLYPLQIPRLDLVSNAGRRGGKPATNRLSCDTALDAV